jgi:hypothetical protein
MRKITITVLGIILLISSIPCCLENEENNDELKEIITNSKKTIVNSTILTPGSVTIYSIHGDQNISEIELFIFDDNQSFELRGDCMTRGRGIILTNFSGLMNKNLNRIFNATLIVKYRTKFFRNYNESFHWSINGTYVPTELVPTNITEYEIEETRLFSNENFNNEDLKKISIKYFCKGGGIAPSTIFLDCLMIKIDYHEEIET